MPVNEPVSSMKMCILSVGSARLAAYLTSYLGIALTAAALAFSVTVP